MSNEAEPEDFTAALESIYRSGEVDAVLVIYAPAIRAHYRRVGAALLAGARSANGVTTVACLLGEHRHGLLADDQVCIPEFPFPEEAALAMGRVARYAAWRSQPVGHLVELLTSSPLRPDLPATMVDVFPQNPSVASQVTEFLVGPGTDLELRRAASELATTPSARRINVAVERLRRFRAASGEPDPTGSA